MKVKAPKGYHFMKKGNKMSLMKNPKGKANTITAKKRYEIKLAISGSEKPCLAKKMFRIRKKAAPIS